MTITQPSQDWFYHYLLLEWVDLLQHSGCCFDVTSTYLRSRQHAPAGVLTRELIAVEQPPQNYIFSANCNSGRVKTHQITPITHIWVTNGLKVWFCSRVDSAVALLQRRRGFKSPLATSQKSKASCTCLLGYFHTRSLTCYINTLWGLEIINGGNWKLSQINQIVGAIFLLAAPLDVLPFFLIKATC